LAKIKKNIQDVEAIARLLEPEASTALDRPLGQDTFTRLLGLA